MSLLSQISMLLFSLTGILFGLALYLIAPEELKEGKKYFLIAKRAVFIAIFFLINYYLLLGGLYPVMVLFVILAVALFVIEIKTRKLVYEIINYTIFIFLFFLNSEPTFRLLLASSIFIYGLPTGTLLKKS